MRSSQRSAQRANPARVSPAVPSRSHHKRDKTECRLTLALRLVFEC